MKCTTTTYCEETPEAVLVLLRDQVTLYGRLERIATQQRSLISLDDVGPLLSLLADRQKISTRLMRLGQRFSAVRREWAQIREGMSLGQRTEANSLLGEIRERMQRVIKSDEQDARLLSARKEVVSEAMRTTHRAGNAMSAYRTPKAQWSHKV